MIRFIPAFVSVVAVALAAGFSFRARLPWLISAYLAVQCVFALCAWWNLCRGEEVFHSHGYRVFFASVFGLTLAVALIVSFGWPLGFRVSLALWPSLLLTLYLLAVALDAPRGLRVTMIQGGVLLFNGVLAFIARAKVDSPELRFTSAALACFWIGLGIFFWAYAVAEDGWTVQNLLIPPMLGIVCFGWLAWKLNGLQSERVLESLRDQSALTELQHLEARP